MKLLLDTHVWLWALHDPPKLSHRVRDVLRNPANKVWLSPVSTWEALLLNAKGRIRLPANLPEWLTAATTPLREAPLTHEIVLIAQQLPLPQRDPTDWFLASLSEPIYEAFPASEGVPSPVCHRPFHSTFIRVLWPVGARTNPRPGANRD